MVEESLRANVGDEDYDAHAEDLNEGWPIHCCKDPDLKKPENWHISFKGAGKGIQGIAGFGANAASNPQGSGLAGLPGEYLDKAEVGSDFIQLLSNSINEQGQAQYTTGPGGTGPPPGMGGTGAGKGTQPARERSRSRGKAQSTAAMRTPLPGAAKRTMQDALIELDGWFQDEVVSRWQHERIKLILQKG